MSNFTIQDQRYMAACLRYARRHSGLTANNPSVGTLLVRDRHIVGRGITSKGGRPHAEPNALAMAGKQAKGATAYVTLEPCAHHGATPPCAQTLIDAGVERVVTAWIDPDVRVDGKGHAMMRDAGMEVETGLMSQQASHDLSGYLNRKQKNRPQVILKLAVSADGMLGREGEEVAITDALAKAYVHRMRAEYDGILVGRGTADTDNPDLTCRLAGLEARSPHRFVLYTAGALSPNSQLAQSARKVATSIITTEAHLDDELHKLGVRHFIAEQHDGQLALPEILQDMAEMGISTLMLEGGAKTAASFLANNLVDEIALFTGTGKVGQGGLRSPVSLDEMPGNFTLERDLTLGDDSLHLFRRKA